MQAILDRIKSQIATHQERLNELKAKFAEDPVYAAQYNLQGVVGLSTAVKVKTILLEQVESGKDLIETVEKLIARATRKIMTYEPQRSTCLVSNAIDQYNRSADLQVLEWLQDLKEEIESASKAA